MAPVGSWRLKRGHGRFSVALNGLVGLASGLEVLDPGIAESESDSLGWVIGPAAMVGADINWGVGDNWTMGFFISVLDLGSLLMFRAGDMEFDLAQGTSATDDATADADAVPPLGFAELFTPGVFLRIGLGNTPFVLALGAYYAPDARHVVETSTPAAGEDPWAADVWAIYPGPRAVLRGRHALPAARRAHVAPPRADPGSPHTNREQHTPRTDAQLEQRHRRRTPGVTAQDEEPPWVGVG